MREGIVRMSIDVAPEYHRKIKTLAAKEGVTIRKFVLNCLEEVVPQGRRKKKKEEGG